LAKCFPHFEEVYHLKFNGIEHYDHFMDETVFYAELTDLPQEIQDAARAIDGPHYDPSCFGICLCYDLKTKTVAIMEETSLSTGEKCSVYYVDNNGDKNWFAVELPAGIERQLFDACMKISTGRDTIQGYTVKEAVLFENRRGVALAENPKAVQPFVTWMFTQQKDGRRDYEWGHYYKDGDGARKDFKARADDYQRRFGVREIRLPIAEQMKQAAELAARENRPPEPGKDAPDKGDR